MESRSNFSRAVITRECNHLLTEVILTTKNLLNLRILNKNPLNPSVFDGCSQSAHIHFVYSGKIRLARHSTSGKLS